MPTEHTSRQFDEELEFARASVLKMGGLVEEQLASAIDILVHRRPELTDAIVAKDMKIDEMQVEIDKLCAQIIARRQPAAVDLRMLMTIIKTITDLERIGNEAKKIASMSRQIFQAERLSSPRFHEIKSMGDIVLNMLRQSLDAFARLDLGVAKGVPRQDVGVDESYDMIMRGLIKYMMEYPRTISNSLEVLFAAKALERIGDHAKNMSEYMVYLIEGKNVRHISFVTTAFQAEQLAQ